jgi:hypothetical protein
MGQLLAISIDVTKLDKSRFVAGKKGTYANLTISVNDQDDAYGNNVSIWEGQTQEEREAKADRNFLGNGKVVWKGEDKGSQSSKPAPKKVAAMVDDLLPF